MTKPVAYARTIVTDDGVPIDAAHLPGDLDLGIVLAHGFTQNWQRPGVWKVATRLNKFGGLIGDVDAVVAVSSPGRWYYRGTRPMRLVHLAVENRTGRMFAKAILKTRISNGKWDPVPLPP